MTPFIIHSLPYSSDMDGRSSNQSNFGSNTTRSDTRRNNLSTTADMNKTTAVTAHNDVTRESLLWFKSLKDNWLNNPRQKIQPILPMPEDIEPTVLTRMETTTTTSPSNNRDDRTSNTMLVENENRTQEERDSSKNVIHRPGNTVTGVVVDSNTNNRDNSLATKSHRERLIQFYTQYNPSKLDTIEQTLKKYLDREDELFKKLQEMYCSKHLPIPQNVNHNRPIVFLEFEYYSGSSNNNMQQHPHRGIIQIKLFHDVTPYASENFRCLCTGEKGLIDGGTKLCYINTFIHRIAPQMCIQGGDITAGDGTGGRSIYPPSSSSSSSSPLKTDLWGNFMDEAFMTHSEPGLLSMANNGPDRNSSQFFITVRSPISHLNGKHVVFGKVIHGMSIVHDIHTHTETNHTTQRPLHGVQIVDCGEIKSITDDENTELWIRSSELRNDSSEYSKFNGTATGGFVSGSSTGNNASLPNGNSSSMFGNGNSFSSSVGSISNKPDCISDAITMKIDDHIYDPIVHTSSQLEQSNEIDKATTNLNADVEALRRFASGTMISIVDSAATYAEKSCLKVRNDFDEDIPITNCFSEVIPNISYDAPAISCHTEPTCRSVFEKLFTNEKSPVTATSSIIDVKSERIEILRDAENMTMPSTPLSQCSNNDESTTTAIDTSYCCDTSNLSVETFATSTSEQVEWLHRLIDDAQHKLRVTRKKFEDRVYELKYRPTILTNDINGTLHTTPDHDIIVPPRLAVHPPTPLLPVGSVTFNAKSSSEYVDSVCKPVGRHHRNTDGKIHLNLLNISPDVGIPLLIGK